MIMCKGKNIQQISGKIIINFWKFPEIFMRYNNKSYGHKFLSQSMRLTNRQTDRKALAIPCVALHAVTR